MSVKVTITVNEDGGATEHYDFDASSVEVDTQYERYGHPHSAVYTEPSISTVKFTVINPRVVKRAREEPTSWKYEDGQTWD